LLVFCFWLYRAHSNLRRLDENKLDYGPAWAFLGFLIPIANLVIPRKVVRDVWLASDPDIPSDQDVSWELGNPTPLVDGWWVFLILSVLIAVFTIVLVALQQSSARLTLAGVRLALLALIAAEVCTVASNLLGARMVLRLQRLQEEKCRRLNAAA